MRGRKILLSSLRCRAPTGQNGTWIPRFIGRLVIDHPVARARHGDDEILALHFDVEVGIHHTQSYRNQSDRR